MAIVLSLSPGAAQESYGMPGDNSGAPSGGVEIPQDALEARGGAEEPPGEPRAWGGDRLPNDP